MALWDKIKSPGGRVEDRRAMAPVVGGISLTGVILLLAINYFMGGNPQDVLNQLEGMPIETQQKYSSADFEGEDDYEVFAKTVLGSNNEMWSKLFEKANKNYHPPTLILFRDATESACGVATTAVGPHYCPMDKSIYLDETFFDELVNRFGAKGGDVAEAYVISHEVGHHVQQELGIMDRVYEAQFQNRGNENELSIKLELQADCFAGLWANSIKDLGVFLPGEIDEAMDAAAAVGDDRIQQKVSGMINPESWTHGTSEQRVASFNGGYESGNTETCNTLD